MPGLLAGNSRIGREAAAESALAPLTACAADRVSQQGKEAELAREKPSTS
jgi:hypothetical protein